MPWDLFLFPTVGENYGHVIQEALSAGCVALISDQTPWQDLEQSGVGAAIPLDQPQRFVDWLRRYAAMDAEPFQDRSDRALPALALGMDFFIVFLNNRCIIDSKNGSRIGGQDFANLHIQIVNVVELEL